MQTKGKNHSRFFPFVFVGEAFFVGKTSCKKFSPHPFQELAHNKYLNKLVCSRTDGWRERKVRFCCRKRVGATKTPRAKNVVEIW